MGIQALVIFVGLALALTVGILAGTREFSLPVAGWLVIALLPVMWGVLYLIERVFGRDVWQYTAPYTNGGKKLPTAIDALRVEPAAATQSPHERHESDAWAA